MSVSKISMRSSPSRYGAVTQLFHWLTVILVGTAYIVSPGGREERIYSAALDSARQTHETFGMLVFALVLLRIVWRLLEPTPEPPPMAPWMRYAASAAHLGLYALLLAIPLTADRRGLARSASADDLRPRHYRPDAAAGACARPVHRQYPYHPGKRHHLAGGTAWRGGIVSSLRPARQCPDLDVSRLEEVACAGAAGRRGIPMTGRATRPLRAH